MSDGREEELFAEDGFAQRAGPPPIPVSALARPVMPVRRTPRWVWVVGSGMLVLLMLGAVLVGRVMLAPKVRNAPESAEARRQAIQQAYGTGTSVVRDQALLAEIDAAVQSIARARLSGNATVMLADLDAERTFACCKEQGFFTNLSARDEAGFVTGMKQGMANSMRNTSGITVTKVKTCQVQRLAAPNEVVAYIRQWYSHGGNSKARWWMKKSSGKWKVYDMEELQAGIRMTTVMGAVSSAAMQTGRTNMQQMLADIRQLQGLAADVGTQNHAAADVKLQALENNTLPPMVDAQRLVLKATVRCAQEQFQAVLTICDEAESKNPDMPFLHQLRAIAYNGTGKFDQALESVKLYTASLGDDSDILLQKGRALEALNRRGEAADAFTQGLADDPTDVRCLAGLARTIPAEKKDDLIKAFAQMPDAKAAFAAATAELFNQQVLEALVRHHQQKFGSDTELLYQLARLKAMQGKDGEGVEILAPLLARVTGDERKRVNELFLEVATAAKQYERAYKSAIDRNAAFDYIAADLVEMEDAANLEKLLALHQDVASHSYHVPYYKGELEMMNKRYREAAAQFQIAVGRAPNADWVTTLRHRYLHARYEAGEAIQAYQQAQDRSAAFETLVQMSAYRKDASIYSALLAAHRAQLKDIAEIAWHEANIAYLREDYAQTAALLTKERAQIMSNQQRFYSYRNMLVRSLVKLRRFDEATAAVKPIDPDEPAPSLLQMLIATAARDQKTAQIILQNSQPWMISMMYKDPEIGPVLKSAEFAKVREKFPPPTTRTVTRPTTLPTTLP